MHFTSPNTNILTQEGPWTPFKDFAPGPHQGPYDTQGNCATEG